MKKIYRFVHRNYDYLLLISTLIVLIEAATYTFLVSDLIKDNGKALTVTLSTIGILLAVFQFAFTQISNRKKKYFDLRYGFYKDTVKQIQLITDVVQEGMLRDVIAGDTMHKLMSASNELTGSMKANLDLLFPGIELPNMDYKLGKTIDDLVSRTNKYYVSVKNNATEAHTIIETMNWHNEVRPMLEQLSKDKHIFFAAMRSYM
ncbi:hypothetical protein MTX78_05850 [Hymenobacter tibetensis]|uniref:Uncharacterized protein n=1 Tax=Hymenobacter tibetensis TaxID=497967 RepID=A0ABY4D1A3_9BACT|nr:hypothetical protein [Hymenobacter tibetensis]UOG76117.1 hypothetical protein MTX78_05850 [Hymenobacter tibetensis]